MSAPSVTRTPNRESQASRIARTLVERISDGTYAVGVRIPSERVLASEFHVSRPVVREALSTVSALEILDIQMGRGAFVTARPAAASEATGSLQDIVNVREILEVGALRLSRGRVTDEAAAAVQAALDDLVTAAQERRDTSEADKGLHRAIVRASGSAVLLSLWQSLEQRIDDSIKVSPHGHIMSRAILDSHRILAEGITRDEVESAIAGSQALHEDNRRFLREFVG